MTPLELERRERGEGGFFAAGVLCSGIGDGASEENVEGGGS